MPADALSSFDPGHAARHDLHRRAEAPTLLGNHRIYLDLEVRRVHCRRCGTVKRERREDFLENVLHSRRFARYIGERCRSCTIKDVAEE
jgi:hypothetical protein